MSWWVSLVDADGKLVQVENFSEGGTYAIGGSTEADLNITYNYSPFYYEYLSKRKGLRWLHGKKAKKTITKLAAAVQLLGTERAADYWWKTKGNTGYALSILLRWAKANPEAIWNVN